jgi:hypothetical protein
MANPSVHYIGSDIGLEADDDHARCTAVWNGIVSQHKANYRPSPAYNFGVCNAHGLMFTGRGWDMDSAANGVDDDPEIENQDSRALLVLVGPGDVITDVCKRSIRDWANEAVNDHGMSWPLRGHKTYVSTSCPGERLMAVIADINANHDGDDEVTREQMDELGRWMKEQRELETKQILDTVGQWLKDVEGRIKAHVDATVK